MTSYLISESFDKTSYVQYTDLPIVHIKHIFAYIQ